MINLDEYYNKSFDYDNDRTSNGITKVFYIERVLVRDAGGTNVFNSELFISIFQACRLTLYQ